MSWELHQAAEIDAAYGVGAGIPYAERLRELLECNGLSLPGFPGMAWAVDQLPDGAEVAVGIAAGENGPLAYVFPAEQVRFDRTEERLLQSESGTPITVRWFTPPR